MRRVERAPAAIDASGQAEAVGEGRRARRLRLATTAVAVALLAVAAFLPVWEARLFAPQYPGGLHLVVSGTAVLGDVEEINALNHYIGMRPFRIERTPEIRLWIPTLLAAIAAAVVSAWTRRRALGRLARIAVWLVPIGVLADIQFRLAMFGHDLDPEAALRLAPFTPWVVGPTKVWNFVTWSYPGLGLLCVLAAAACLSFGPRVLGRLGRSTPVLAAALVVLALVVQPVAAGEPQVYDHGHAPTTKMSVPAAGGEEHSDLAARIAGARPGDTVTIQGGRYHGDLVIDRPLTLQGSGRPLVHGTGSGSVITIRAKGVTLRGLAVAGGAPGPVGTPAGIRVEADDALIEDVDVRDTYLGIAGVNVRRLRIVRATVTGRGGAIVAEAHATAEGHAPEAEARRPGRGDGISLVNVQDALVRDVSLRDVRDGIYVSFGAGILIDRVAVDRSRYALHSMFAKDITVAESRFVGNRSGAVLMYGERALLLRTAMSHNRSASTGFGVLGKDVVGLQVIESQIVGNRVGVQVDGQSGIGPESTLVRGSTIAQNNVGVALTPMARATFTRNNIVDNAVQVASFGGAAAGGVWAREGAGNFWSTYRGFDVRGDGVGDLPHAEGGATAAILASAPMLSALSSSPAMRLLRALEGRWADLEPLAVDELPLVRPLLLHGSVREGARATIPFAATGVTAAILAGSALAWLSAPRRRVRHSEGVHDADR